MDIESYCEKLEEWSEMSVNKYEGEADSREGQWHTNTEQGVRD